MLNHSPDHRTYTSSLWDYAVTAGVDAKLQILVDPLSVFMILVVSGVSTMIHLYSVVLHDRRQGLRALLRVPELLRLLDAAAGPGRQLRAADRRLGVRRRCVLSADQLLVPPPDRDPSGHQGVRDQRRRRCRVGAGHVPAVPAHRHRRLPEDVRGRRPRVRSQQHGSGSRVCTAARRRVREVGPGAAPHVAPRRDGGPDAGLRADPCRDDGDRRRVPDRAHAPTVRARTDRGRCRSNRRWLDASDRRHDRDRPDRHQTSDRLFDDVPDRLHDHGRFGRGVFGRPVPPDDARVLQGAAVHGRRLDHRSDGRRSVARPDGGISQGAAVHACLLCSGRLGPVGPAAVFGVAVEGRHPRVHRPPRWRIPDPRDRRLLLRRSSPGSTHSG